MRRSSRRDMHAGIVSLPSDTCRRSVSVPDPLPISAEGGIGPSTDPPAGSLHPAQDQHQSQLQARGAVPGNLRRRRGEPPAGRPPPTPSSPPDNQADRLLGGVLPAPSAPHIWCISSSYAPTSANDGYAAITWSAAASPAVATLATTLATPPTTSSAYGRNPPRPALTGDGEQRGGGGHWTGSTSASRCDDRQHAE
jgi:hypothetical protein